MIKKIMVIPTIILLIFPVISAQALEAPEPPSAPEPPPIETQAVSPSAPAAPTPPLLTDAESSQNSESPETEDSNQDSDNNQNEQISSDLSGPNTNGNVGDTTINTGDGLTTGTLTTAVNSNTSLQESLQQNGDQTTAENTNNGSDSTNAASLDEESGTGIIQDNNADITNSLELNTNTGGSSASQNVGDSTITTGDANTSGTVVMIANTNLAGLAVSEFNVVDDTQGDIVLDFASGCILGCEIFNPSTITNTGNGSDSTNNAAVNQIMNNYTFQNNEATLENNMLLTANSGDNQADQNTGGDSAIETGDANISANVINFLNNNIAGNIILGVVNIFGELIGDIILPEDQLNTTLATAANIGNGSGSTNSALIDNEINNTTVQTNDALIQNNLDFEANTGENQTSKNTGGNSVIETGEASIESQTINIANSSLNGGNWWLVLVNAAGTWVGKILGAEDQSNIAGSSKTEFLVDSNGDITVTNTDNGAGSTNNASSTQVTNTNTVQNNIAQIINNINLFANTGRNSASKNTGGDSTIKTGNADVIANLVNFVNNNITGGGRLTVTIVNVFSSWIGDFVTPGNQKETTTVLVNKAVPAGNPISNASTNPLITVQSANQPSPSSIITAPTGISSTSYANENQQAYVAGAQFENNSNNPPSDTTNAIQNNHKPIELNLAWLLLLLPFGAVTAVLKLKKLLTV